MFTINKFMNLTTLKMMLLRFETFFNRGEAEVLFKNKAKYHCFNGTKVEMIQT